ncbi:MAG TPA: hypothetical protein PLP47_01385 [Methanofastidiosum sp.]|nr:hypothetical protein [Methanofastidiosum sp.]
MGVLPTWDENETGQKPKKSFYERLPKLLPSKEDVDNYEFDMKNEIKYFVPIVFMLALIIVVLYLQK